MADQIEKANNVQVVRSGFGDEERQQFETAAAAVAARQQALVNARFIMALKKERSIDDFRAKLLHECERPGFAEMAEYSRPVGKEYNQNTETWEEKIAHGPSIHLIRTALALYRNIDADSVTVFENSESRVTHTYVLDLETNVGWGRTIVISKIVEKRGWKGRHGIEPPKGRDVIQERVNSSGDKVYICLATEDEVRVKEAALVAKAQRENGRSLLPRDILEEAISVAHKTIETQDKADPDAARRKVIDAFATVNVMPMELSEYLGHPVDKVTPAELVHLRKIFVALREGEASWTDVMAERDPVGLQGASEQVAAEKLAKLRDWEKQQKTQRKAETAQPLAAEPPVKEAPRSAAAEVQSQEPAQPRPTPAPSGRIQFPGRAR